MRVRRDEGGFLGSIRMTETMALDEPHVFYPSSLQMRQTLKRMKKPPALRFGGSFTFVRSDPMLSLQALALAAR